MERDYILNGTPYGGVGELMYENQFDPGMFRPFFDRNGERVVTINTGRVIHDNKRDIDVPERRNVPVAKLIERGISNPVLNSTTLRKAAWIELDRVVVKEARQRLRAWSDLASRNSFGGFNGFAKMTLEYEAMNDPGEAMVDMDVLTAGRTDVPLFKLRSLPLPITHSDFFYSKRRLDISRGSGTALDLTSAEAAARRVSEMVERTLIGTETGVTYGTQSSGYAAHDGNSTVFGYTNFTPRLTKTNMTVPTGSNPEVTLADFLACRKQLQDNLFYGPYMVYHSTDWDQWLDNDYARLGGNNASMTLRDRLKAIDGIEDVKRLDFLTSTYTMIFVQMTSDVARAINGMDLTTLQWESQGGQRLNFKVMCIQVPQLRSTFSGKTGILHATTA